MTNPATNPATNPVTTPETDAVPDPVPDPATVELHAWGAHVLTGTGLSIDQAAAYAANDHTDDSGHGAPGDLATTTDVPAACLNALRDGWTAALPDRGGDER